MGELIEEAQIGQSIVLDSAFLAGKAKITPSSEPFLQYIVEYMKQYPSYIVMISTHAEKHPTREESQLLSEQRALAIIQYLTSNGVSRERLEFKAYGHDIVVNMDNLPTLKYMKERMPASVEFRLIGFKRRL